MQKPISIAELIRLWPSRRELAEDAGDNLETVHKWAQCGRIPIKRQKAILDAAKRRGLPVDAELLVSLNGRGAA